MAMEMPAGSSAPDFAEVFSLFSSALTVDLIPATALEAACVNIHDTLACATAGISAPGVAEVLGLVESWGGAPQASILCTSTRVPAHHAALVNGMMAHARDYDDTHDAAVLHAGVSVVPAALAAAELNPAATGADLLAGVVAGLELVCRLGVATRIGIIDSGFIYTSLFGYFGATAAAARVMGLDAAQTVNAIGIAYSQAAGTHQVTRDAATTKRMQPGLAAKAALLSVQMSLRGIRGAQLTFEGADGLFRTYLRNEFDPSRLRAGLGTIFELESLSYKPYPCCRFNHTAIDAALAIRAQPGFHVDRVRRISAGVNRQAFEAVCTPAQIRQAPATVVQAQFSIPYTVACALLDGEVKLAHFGEESLKRADLQRLGRLTECSIDDEIERDWGRSISPTRLVVETDSDLLEVRVDLPRGDRNAPMSKDDRAAKLRDCLVASELAWRPSMAVEVDEAIENLKRSGAASDLARLFRFN